MPGFGFDDDELKKLFAEAGDVVKKAAKAPGSPVSDAPPSPVVEPAAPPAPAPPAPSPVSSPPPAAAPVVEAQAEERVDYAVEDSDWAPPRPQTSPAAASPAGGGAGVRLMGGEQEAGALVGRKADGTTVRIPWGEMGKLSVARVGDRYCLAFTHRGEVYYFNDENVAYKGLLKQLAATLTLNWRALVNEISSQVSDRSDAGIQAMTGAGGSVPRYGSLADFLKAVSSRA